MLGWTLPTEPNAAADLEAGKIEFMRKHTGRDFRIMLDGHMDNSPNGIWSLETAIAVTKSLEPYDLFFLEEPLPYTDPGDIRNSQTKQYPDSGRRMPDRRI